MAARAEEAFPRAGRWRPGRGRRLRPLDRRKARGQSADGERAHAGADRGETGARQAHQAVDHVSPQRGRHPRGEAEKIAPYNPLRRVPTLVLDSGEAMIESHIILDYLDELVGEEKAMIAP